ncbi:MAG TPA: citrate/2-methylcitrate synthase, partial [Thermomicrobiaceae bacterium]|nr:citrate/2-methylcitrate synthase [Thermomicrobiaceae bacterium]
PQYYDMSVKMDEVMTREKGLLPNVDFYAATVYHFLGIPTDLMTPVFATSRTAGWSAHVMEQYANNRLIRPRADYVGVSEARYVPIDQRG